MGTPFYNLPSPDDERDEDEERLSQDEWLAQYGPMRQRAPVVSKPVPDIMRPQPAPSAPVTAPQRTPEPKQDVWSALATKNAPKPKLAPVATPSEQITTEAQKQQALGNPDKAAQLVTQAAHQGAQENAAAGQQGARPVPELPTVGNSAVARSQRPVAQGGHGIDLGQPPEYQAPSAGNYWVALIADALLNKGRGAGRIVQGFTERPDAANVNYQRRVQHAKDVANIDATQRRGFLSPEEEELRQARLEIARGNLDARKEQIGQQGESLEFRKTQHYESTHPESDKANAAREYLRGKGVDVSQLEGMGYESIKSAVQPALKNDLEIAMGEQMNALAADKARATAEATIDPKARTAAAISDATQEDKLELVREGAALRNQAAAQSPQMAMDERKFYAAEADKYNKYTEFYRTAGAFLKDAEEVMARHEGGDVPGIGMADSRVPEMALSDDGLRMRQAQSWMNNAIQRADSGAAAPIPEELKFAIRSGSQPGATEKQVREGLRAAKIYITTQLRGAATGHPEAARGVLRESGIEEWVYPPAAPSPRPRAQPTRASRPAAPPQTQVDAPLEAGMVLSDDDFEEDEP